MEATLRTILEYALYAFCFLSTGLLALFPRAIWHLEKWCFIEREEPSEFYFDMLRIVSAILFFIFVLGLFM